MSRMNKFMEKQKKLSRFQALKSIFSSMIMTVSVVVIATIAIPKSPQAEIIDLDIFSNKIVYNVFVQDSDSAIIEDTLQVEINNQTETIKVPLDVGQNTGVINELSEDTEYTLRVLADKGFGLEVLDKETFKTFDKTGGAFISVDLLSDPLDFELDYSIGLFINDPFDEYNSIQIRYGIQYAYSDEVVDYNTLAINKLDTEFILNNIFNEDVKVHIYLEAFNNDMQLVELDYMVIQTPFSVSASIYMSQVSYNQASCYVYPDYYEDIEIDYELVLYRNYTEEDRYTIENQISESEFEPHYQEQAITFTSLKPDVEYTLKLIAHYNDPYTLVEKTEVIATTIFTTLVKPRYDIEVIEQVEAYEVILTLDEPIDSYDRAYYVIFEETEFGQMQYDYQEYILDYYENQYHVSMYIPKPMLTDYTFKIGIKDSLNYINYSILYTDEYHEEVE